MSHLAAMAILLAEEPAQVHPRAGIAGCTGAAQAAGLIDRLRSSGLTLTYDPDERTLRADTGETVTVGAARS